MNGYTEDHAKSGLGADLPVIEVWPNQFIGYEITIQIPEFTSICPKTHLPDFAACAGVLLVGLACRPVRAVVRGEFNFRGGMKSIIEARHPRKSE